MKKMTNESHGAVHTESLKENKKKNIKGITLVALVVTIIILLILAGISISVLTQTGLFGKAKQAERKSKDAQELENLTLGSYENSINNIDYSIRENDGFVNTEKKDLWTTWLYCANIDYRQYQSNNLLTNQKLMEDLMENRNSVDYLFQSTVFLLPKVIDSEIAMNALKNSDYALEKCIADRDITMKIINSNFKSVLDSKIRNVPKMTSNNSPEGECFSTTPFNSSLLPYRAFDGDASTGQSNTDFAYRGTGKCYIGYKFKEPINIYKFELKQRGWDPGNEGLNDATMYYSDDGINWIKASKTFTLRRDFSLQTYETFFPGKHIFWKVESSAGYGGNGGLSYLQFYGF